LDTRLLNKTEWAQYRMRLRYKIASILKRLDEGEVDEVELAQLHNFTMTAMMLLSKVSPGQWEAAKKETEIAAWVRGEMFDVVMDEELLG
jgi:hypothetical protein